MTVHVLTKGGKQADASPPSPPGGRPRLPARRGPSNQAVRLRRLAAQAAVITMAVLIWWYGSVNLPRNSMPGPAETIAVLVKLASAQAFWSNVGITIGTFLLGLAVCAIIGIPVGLAIGASKFATESTRLVFDFLRTIPPIAILPLILLLHGATFQMVFVLVVLGAIWPILIQSVYAARQGEPQLAEMAAAYRVPRRWFITHIFFPGALPFIMTGLRVTTTVCLLLTITAQLLGGAPGVGAQIQDALTFADTPRMYAYVLVAAVLGLIVNGVFFAVQRYILRWHASARKEGGR
ncbi:ABC transporter permease [Arthrobacter sp. 2MCAF15]|uniref:ABC transporter permease n=1 Tax=Arthrobacter sp. 2MCAF15 TaxID=3232984 RepID=UPI003F8DCBAA